MQTYVRIGALVVIALTTCSSEMLAQSHPPRNKPDVNEIMAKSVQAIKHDWEEAPKYDCFERDRLPHGTKSYKNLMIDGSPYQMLVKVNGKSLSAQQEAEEKQKLQETIAKRKAESPQQRQQRIQQYQLQTKRNHELIDQMTQAFDFHLQGEQKLNGFEVYVLKATPRPGYKATSTQTEVLKGMKGELWIDKNTYQWVKVEAQVVHPVNIYGFMAQVEPGTRFELVKMPAGDDVWLRKHFSMKARAEVLWFFSQHRFDDVTYYGCSVQTQKF
jgi:hypothetical protein